MTGSHRRYRYRLWPRLAVGAVLCAAQAANATAQGSAAGDRAVLEALYDATGGPSWTDNSNWRTSASLGEWFGVTTDGAGRVTQLALPGNGLGGRVPDALGHLGLLRSLNLAANELTGLIPAGLGSLVNLHWLVLTGNTLTGPIPAELGTLVNLEVLDLGANELTGPIPTELGSLVNLWLLAIGENDLTGPIPETLGNMVNLEELRLHRNSLTGPIPDALGSLANLHTLRLQNNELTGPIPSALGSLTSLRHLWLDENFLTGSIPDTLGGLANLEELSLQLNGLTGPIPDALGSLANLRELHLAWNPLSGRLPGNLSQLSRLTTLDIRFTAACAPADAALRAWLATIDFRGATCNRPPEPVGMIPAQSLTESGPAIEVPVGAYFSDADDDPLTYSAASGNAGAVTALALGDTVWLVPGSAGTVTVTVTASDPAGLNATQPVAVSVDASTGPQSDREVLEVLFDSTGGESWTNRGSWKTSAPLNQWYGLTADADGRVTELRLEDNGLAGPVPVALGGLARLELLSLGSNALTGPIPAALGRLSNLRSLSLGGNELTGRIPDALGNLSNLESLSLGGNGLAGPVPAALGRLSNLRSLSLGGNELTGRIPDALGDLSNLESLSLGGNGLAGPVPAALGNLSNLRSLSLGWNELTGRIPDALGRLTNLEELRLDHNWDVTGELPPGLLELPSLEVLDFVVTQACAPAAWRDRLASMEFTGRLCELGTDVRIDVAVVYTPAARDAAGGSAAIEAVIDLMVAEVNQAYAASGVHHRLRLVERSVVSYVETGNYLIDFDRFADPSDGHMDGVHALRDRVGADLVHLIFEGVGGVANLGGPFGATCRHCGGLILAHELGHNMWLLHDRYQAHHHEGGVSPHPAYGYVNQLALGGGATRSKRRWQTIMAYSIQCLDAHDLCTTLLRFSNPRQSYEGDPLGVPFGQGSGVTGPADAAAVLDATGPVVALWRDQPPSMNRPPTAGSAPLPDRKLTLPGTLTVDVSQAFNDPDGDPLTYTVSSSAPDTVAVQAAGARVTLTAVGEGTAAIRVTATDAGGLSATQAFTVTVAAMRAPFTDDPLVPGMTPIKAVHFTELRARIDTLRRAAGRTLFSWTDPVLRPGVTRVQWVHLLELRAALAEAYAAAGRAAPRWTDPSPASGSTPIRALHLTELRAGVLALELE